MEFNWRRRPGIRFGRALFNSLCTNFRYGGASDWGIRIQLAEPLISVFGRAGRDSRGTNKKINWRSLLGKRFGGARRDSCNTNFPF
eukprot:8815875-Karenia_brevis.AAC.1